MYRVRCGREKAEEDEVARPNDEGNTDNSSEGRAAVSLTRTRRGITRHTFAAPTQ